MRRVCMHVWHSLDDLPSLPEPDVIRIKREESNGWLLVLGIIFACALTVHVAQFLGQDPRLWLAVGMVYLQAAIAVGSHARILSADPGVVERSAESCLPFPVDVCRLYMCVRVCWSCRNLVPTASNARHRC